MKILDSSEIPEFFSSGSCVALGTFDGVHLGHQEIIRKCIEISRENNWKSLSATFYKSPSVSMGKAPIRLLTPTNEKNLLMRESGIDSVCYLDSLSDIFHTEAEDFYKNILLGILHTRGIVMGFNFRFGKQRKGNVELLSEWCKRDGILLWIQEPVYLDQEIISSTIIRDHISKGQVALAGRMLGRNYSFQGKVVHGRKMGRKMGLPTANLQSIEPLKYIPVNGVYSVSVLWNNKKIPGVMNIGRCPTIDNELRNITLEVHLLDFHEILYGETLIVEFHQWLREEKNFPNRTELSTQIHKDIEITKSYFNRLYSGGNP